MRVFPDAGELLRQLTTEVEKWEASFGGFASHQSLGIDQEKLGSAIEEYLQRLTAPPGEDGGNYPFFHPRYAGQMLKPPHPVAVASYGAVMRINPNNHALDGGPPTGQMEKEVVDDLAQMFGYSDSYLGHLTGGGTIANLEALFVARELHPEKGIAYSSDAHYTHGRMARVLGLESTEIPADVNGRIELNALERALRTGSIGTVVLTATTTGLGAVDEIADALPLARQYGARVHVDAAYGGFFALIRDEVELEFPVSHFAAIAEADSVVVDPHKHGLQPYGCGCVLFKNQAVGKFYKHDSPYTYFSSEKLHLGEISLECSRAGAAAAALWLTLRCIPLKEDEGLGPILKAGLRAARNWAALIDSSDSVDLFVRSETDILTFVPNAKRISEIDLQSKKIFELGMRQGNESIYLSTIRMSSHRLAAVFPHVEVDAPGARILRSVLMKPEHEHYVDRLHESLEKLAS